MLKSQRHYYWIGGGIWALLLAAGALVLIFGTGPGGRGAGLGGLLDGEVFASADIVAGSEAARTAHGAILKPAGTVDIGPAGLQMTDPIAEPDRAALALSVPEGRYPVEAYVPASDPDILGIVALRLGPGEIARWERVSRTGLAVPLDFGVDEIFALGDAAAIAALAPGDVRTALQASRDAPPTATLQAAGRAVVVFDPSFETLSSAIYAGYDSGGALQVVAKDFGYFATAEALQRRARDPAGQP